MTRISSKLIIGTAALLLSAGLAFAQTTPTAPPAAAPKAATPPPAATPKAVTPPAAAAPVKAPVKASGQKKATTPEGIACSAEADTKGLKGKERKTFRRKCIADAKKAAAAPPAPAKKN